MLKYLHFNILNWFPNNFKIEILRKCLCNI